jgi:WD40 repeat protein
MSAERRQRRVNPFVGPRPFLPGEPLFGRDREVFELRNLLVAERIVVLYSPSGAGKTSLVQAGLIPKMTESDFHVLPLIRVNQPPVSGDGSGANRYLESAIRSLEEGVPGGEDHASADRNPLQLGEYLSQRPRPPDAPGADLLIFDQFEEILTLDPTDYEAKTEFFRQVGDALRSEDRWALFTLREDHLAGFDRFRPLIPTRLATSFRLEFLSREAAALAIRKTADVGGVGFTEEAAEQLVRDLSLVRVQQPDGSSKETPGVEIEPVQLQVVCHRLWNQLPPAADQIDLTMVEQYGKVSDALGAFYADTVAAVATQTGVPERDIRAWIDENLITKQGIRAQVLQEPGQSAGLDDEAITALIDAHLVRAETRRGARWLELAHDRLIAPVRASNDTWYEENLNALQQAAKLWHRQGRTSGYLLTGEALTQAEQWAADHPENLTAIDRAFLSDSQDQRTLQDAERRDLEAAQRLAEEAQARQHAEEAARQEAELREAEQAKAAKGLRRALWVAAALLAFAVLGGLVAVNAIAERDAERQKAQVQGIGTLATAVPDQVAQGQTELARLLAQEAFLLDQDANQPLPEVPGVALRAALSAPNPSRNLAGQEGIAFSVAFSPDGQTLASGGRDGRVRVWDVDDPAAEPSEFSANSDRIFTVAFSPDNQTLATGGEDATVRLWKRDDVAAQPRELLGHEDAVEAVAFSPDGQTLATGEGNGSVRLWNLGGANSAATPTVLDAHEAAVNALAFSLDGQTLATGGKDGDVRLWNLDDLEAAPVTLSGHEGSVEAVSFSPDGQSLASGGGDDRTVRVWDLSAVDAAAAPALLPGQGHGVEAVAFSPNGRILASGDRDGHVRLWGLGDLAAEPLVLMGHTAPVWSVAFRPDGQTLASGGSDATIRLWNVGNLAIEPQELAGHEEAIVAIAFSPDGQLLTSGDRDGDVRRWDLGDVAADSVRLASRDEPVDALALSPDGQLLATGGADGTVQLWRLAVLDSGPEALSGPSGPAEAIALSADGQTLAVGDGDGTVWVWDLGDLAAKPREFSGHEGQIAAVAFSPDSQTLASGSADGTVRLWDLDAADPGAAPTVLSGHRGAVNTVVFSPDGRTLATAGGDATVRVWSLGDLTAEPTLLTGASKTVSSLAFSPDRATLAAGGRDGAVRLWRVSAPDAVPEALRGQLAPVTTVAFSPDGQTLAVGGDDGTVRVWSMNAERLAETVCQVVSRNLELDEWRQFMGADTPYRPTCPDLPDGSLSDASG